MNSVTASVTAERTRPAVRSRRTAVTFDSAGGLRLGGIAQFSMAVTDFADLGRDPDTVIVGGRIWSPANLVAAVVNELRAVEPGASEAGVVTTYPAIYSDKQVALLRQALDLSGAGDVLLVPEPVAAAEWLEHEHGPLETSFVLVYDLGGTSLDVTIVRVGPDWDNHPMIGKPMRSYDFGGRPLGSMIARYAPDAPPKSTRLSMTSLVDIDGLRVAHIQDSLELVRECVRSAGITMSDIGRILLVGGASRPAEVARTLAELGRPVVISADPGHTIAAGAALMAARTMALGAASDRGNAPRVAVFSSAAVVSAVAMSAVTVFGGPTVPELSPMLERLPDLEAPADNLLYEVGGERFAEAWSRMSAPAGWNANRVLPAFLSPRTSAYTRFITPVPRSASYGPSVSESRIGSHRDPRNCCTQGGLRRGGYGDPAYFANPLPFDPVVRVPGGPAGPVSGVPGGLVVGGAPEPGQLPVAVPGAGTPEPAHPGGPIPVPGVNFPTSQGDSTSPVAHPASGATSPGAMPGTRTDPPATGTSDTQGSGASSGQSGSGETGTPGGSAPGEPTGGASSGGSDQTSTGGTSSSTDSASGNASTSGSTGNSSSGGTAGGSSSNGSSGGSSSGGSTDGSSSAGSTGGSSSSGSTGGSSSHGSTGGSSSHGSTGGSSSHGSAGGSSTGGSASGARPGGASSRSGSVGGNSSGASSSGGSSSRSGSVGGSKPGGSSAGGGAGASGASGGARGR
ncbi:Hsp70 family protein [Nocardia pneumoniae]|uniref:Hsp70 family protein n=1 Tax=Nocardia pneumoniae TaxID=228601 RepID=UPI0006888A7A|nr:Hsp70 family protein [Nocardia pneumoniae]